MAAILPRQPAITAHKFRNILFIRPGGIGDAVFLAPAIRSLKKFYPAINITILAEKRNAGVFPLIPFQDVLLCYDRSCELAQVLRRSYDVVIDTEQWHRLSALVARFVSAPVKIGFDTNERRRMFNYPIPYSHEDYETASFAHFLEPLGIKMDTIELGAPFLFPPEATCVKVAGLLAALNDATFVAVFPGASIAERRWGAERFRRVAEMLSTIGIKIVVVGGREDRHQGEVIAGGGLGLNLAGLTSLSETAAVIQKSALLVSGDSGVLHIAVGLGVPTVSLFGPGRAKKWAPRGDNHIVLNKKLPCSPCTTFGTTPPCPNGNRCMSDISVENVVTAAKQLLSRSLAS
ncbi:MAG: glycosyltransferase family 9 protein [Desulfuromonadaceae bacterium]|nr:glycosyltransferase family 9 protein [Desulfuromonadaceae bacterium]MDD5106401.1 glycosyltransferase family 9 protein [Desulfuromonadaceae bacterium]